MASLMSEGKVPATVHTTDTQCFLTLLHFIGGGSNGEIFTAEEGKVIQL